MSEQETKKRFRYRIDIIAIIALFVLTVTFCAYMMNTGLEETLKNERGAEIVTHDYTFEDSSSQNDK